MACWCDELANIGRETEVGRRIARTKYLTHGNDQKGSRDVRENDGEVWMVQDAREHCINAITVSEDVCLGTRNAKSPEARDVPIEEGVAIINEGYSSAFATEGFQVDVFEDPTGDDPLVQSMQMRASFAFSDRPLNLEKKQSHGYGCVIIVTVTFAELLHASLIRTCQRGAFVEDAVCSMKICDSGCCPVSGFCGRP